MDPPNSVEHAAEDVVGIAFKDNSNRLLVTNERAVQHHQLDFGKCTHTWSLRTFRHTFSSKAVYHPVLRAFFAAFF